ncbi:unnamed protein product [Paramecium pentaurelia]|uniref:Uncharacterized protein n=1 Tax=Paramecium pentaurelia TaxID=43138 RepID=A0A8S1W729_9CILI|nr:unnamed protein product [Paramecium pentaurelia]
MEKVENIKDKGRTNSIQKSIKNNESLAEINKEKLFISIQRRRYLTDIKNVFLVSTLNKRSIQAILTQLEVFTKEKLSFVFSRIISYCKKQEQTEVSKKAMNTIFQILRKKSQNDKRKPKDFYINKKEYNNFLKADPENKELAQKVLKQISQEISELVKIIKGMISEIQQYNSQLSKIFKKAEEFLRIEEFSKLSPKIVEWQQLPRLPYIKFEIEKVRKEFVKIQNKKIFEEYQIFDKQLEELIGQEKHLNLQKGNLIDEQNPELINLIQQQINQYQIDKDIELSNIQKPLEKLIKKKQKLDKEYKNLFSSVDIQKRFYLIPEIIQRIQTFPELDQNYSKNKSMLLIKYLLQMVLQTLEVNEFQNKNLNNNILKQEKPFNMFKQFQSKESIEEEQLNQSPSEQQNLQINSDDQNNSQCPSSNHGTQQIQVQNSQDQNKYDNKQTTYQSYENEFKPKLQKYNEEDCRIVEQGDYESYIRFDIIKI